VCQFNVRNATNDVACGAAATPGGVRPRIVFVSTSADK
jgi:hypothetical protein